MLYAYDVSTSAIIATNFSNFQTEIRNDCKKICGGMADTIYGLSVCHCPDELLYTKL